MSDQFPMPKSLDAPRPVPGFDRPATPPPVSDYAPRPAPQRGLEAGAQAVEGMSIRESIKVLTHREMREMERTDAGRPAGKLGQHTQAIRESIKLLTHREMREMVAAIFEAYHMIEDDKGELDAIAKADLADVLDAFAYAQ